MDEQTSWKGHSFTLLIFAGIVALCAVFFVLGMVAGRSQRSELVVTAPISSEPSADQEDAEDLELSFYDAVDEIQPPPLESPEAAAVESAQSAPEPAQPVASVPPPALAPAEVPPEAPASTGAGIILQVAALSNSEQADILREQIASRGLPAFVLRPPADGSSSLYRVRVGPFDDPDEADRVLEDLESAGYEPIISN